MKTWKLSVVAATLFAALFALPMPESSAKEEPKAGEKTAKAAWKEKDKVDIEWHKKWWRGIVLEVVPPDSYKVHYVGFSAKNDEVVPTSRLRARTTTSLKGAFDDGAE